MGLAFPVEKEEIVYGVIIFAEDEPLCEYVDPQEAIAVAKACRGAEIRWKVKQETPWMSMENHPHATAQ